MTAPDAKPSDTVVAGCQFCGPAIRAAAIAGFADGFVFAVKDRYPVTQGHTLIIPRRHVATYFDLTADERRAADELMERLLLKLTAEDPRISGYNIGVNSGVSAGQTIFHVHYHLVPRREGDTADPRGGVRGVIPGKRRYPQH